MTVSTLADTLLLRRRSAASGATDFPSTGPVTENGLHAWARHTRILANRQLRVWFRDRPTMLQSLIVPAISMVMFKVVLGDTIGAATGRNSAYGVVPMVVLVGAMFGSMAAAVRLAQERKTGFLTRLYVLPVHRSADLSARVIAELVRIVLTSSILLAVGYLIGFRIHNGPLAALGIIAIALAYGAAFSTMVLAFAVNSRDLPLVPILTLFSSLAMFFNSGFAPIDAFPGWLQPIVANQPMTCAIEVMRSLADSGPIMSNLIPTLLWTVAIAGIFTIPAIRGYRRAAASGH